MPQGKVLRPEASNSVPLVGGEQNGQRITGNDGRNIEFVVQAAEVLLVVAVVGDRGLEHGIEFTRGGAQLASLRDLRVELLDLNSEVLREGKADRLLCNVRSSVSAAWPVAGREHRQGKEGGSQLHGQWANLEKNPRVSKQRRSRPESELRIPVLFR